MIRRGLRWCWEAFVVVLCVLFDCVVDGSSSNAGAWREAQRRDPRRVDSPGHDRMDLR